MAAIFAFVCFLLAALKIEPFDSVAMLPLGLMFLALALLVGNWPLGVIGRR